MLGAELEAMRAQLGGSRERNQGLEKLNRELREQVNEFQAKLMAQKRESEHGLSLTRHDSMSQEKQAKLKNLLKQAGDENELYN